MLQNLGKQQFLYPGEFYRDFKKQILKFKPISEVGLLIFFVDVERGVTLETHPIDSKPEEVCSRDSDKTVSVSGSGSFSLSTDSDRTPVRVDSQDSQVSDGEPDRGNFF